MWVEAKNNEDQAVVALLQCIYPPRFLQASGQFPSNAAQQAICLIHSDSALLARPQPGICHNPQVLLGKAAAQLIAPQIAPMHGVILLYGYFSLLNVVKFLSVQPPNFSILPKSSVIQNIKHSP